MSARNWLDPGRRRERFEAVSVFTSAWEVSTKGVKHWLLYYFMTLRLQVKKPFRKKGPSLNPQEERLNIKKGFFLNTATRWVFRNVMSIFGAEDAVKQNTSL